jgi:hyperosmotically inducible periplasmic protein
MQALNMRKALATLVALGAFSTMSFSLKAQTNSSPPAPDNTKVNQRDRSKTEPTADQGKNNLSDRDLMQKIRKSLMDDKSLSTSAHNVKIVAQNGQVTLKGPVASEDEKRAVEQKATSVAGSGNVTDEMTVKPARNKKAD